MSNTWTYNLSRGHSADPSGGACAMDAVNWLVHGKHGRGTFGASILGEALRNE